MESQAHLQQYKESVLADLISRNGEARAHELLKFWQDHRLDPPGSGQDVEDFFFQEVSE